MSKLTRANKPADYFIRYAIVTLGSVIYGIGFQFFLKPNSIVSGGVVGISMIINQLTDLPVGMMTIILNLPLFMAAWRFFGMDFLIGSLAGMGLSSVFVDILATLGISATNDVMLAAVIGGAIKGLGLGMIYYVGFTTGGIDIVAKLLKRKYPYINFGTMVFILDIAIIAAYALVLNRLEAAMYSGIAMFVNTKVIDIAIYGVDNSVVCYIISQHSEEIREEITGGMIHRGVTILEGRGGFSGDEKHVLFCVIKRHQMAEMKKIVRAMDDHAFFIVTEAKNVFGKGFENISEVR